MYWALLSIRSFKFQNVSIEQTCKAETLTFILQMLSGEATTLTVCKVIDHNLNHRHSMYFGLPGL